jgi:hypothetical protein
VKRSWISSRPRPAPRSRRSSAAVPRTSPSASPERSVGTFDTTPEHAAVRHILTAPVITERTAAHIGDEEVDVAGLLAEVPTMAGGEAPRLTSEKPS